MPEKAAGPSSGGPEQARAGHPVRGPRGSRCGSSCPTSAAFGGPRQDELPPTRLRRQARAAAPLSGFRRNEAAQESNLPTDGLHRPAGFEDRMGHRAPAAPRRAVYGHGAVLGALGGSLDTVYPGAAGREMREVRRKTARTAYSASASASTPSLARRRMRSRVSSIRSRSSAVSSSATDDSGSGGSYAAKAAAGAGGGW